MPIISITANNPTQQEGNSGTTAYTFTVTRSGDTSAESTVDWQIAGSGSNPATVATDFYTASGAAAGSITFAAGETSKTITIYVLGDTEVEEFEEFAVVLSSPTNASLDNSSAISFIWNDDLAVPPSIAISALDANKPEGNGGDGNWTPFTFQVQRTGDLSNTSTVSWTVPNLSYDTPQPTYSSLADIADFRTAALEGAVSFAPNESTKTITIEINGDTQFEQDQSFIVRLSNAVNAIISSNEANGVIQNDDSAVSISTSTATIPEGHSGTQFIEYTVTRQGKLDQPASVDWITSGTGSAPITVGIDIEEGIGKSHGTLNFASGESSKTIQIAVIGDTNAEVNESLIVTLVNSIGMHIVTSAASSTIINDDALAILPSLSIQSLKSSTFEGNSGGKTVTFAVTRTGDTAAPSSAQWTINGAQANGLSAINPDDLALYTSGMSGTVNFAAGETIQFIDININGDTTIEPDEVLEVVLSTPALATISTPSASTLIVNDDGISIVALDASSDSQAEGNSGLTNFQYTVTRSGDMSIAASVNWSIAGSGTNPADMATDFSADSLSGTVNFAAGESSKTIQIKVVGDTTSELNESFAITVTNQVGTILAKATASSSIINDDTPTNMPILSIQSSDASKYEGNSGSTPFTFEVIRTGDLSIASSAGWWVEKWNTTTTSVADAHDFTQFTSGMGGNVTFAPGQSSAIITLQILGDTTAELNESFNVILHDPVLAIIATGSASALIKDDDGIPSLTLSTPSSSQAETNSDYSAFQYTLTRSGNLSATASVDWRIAAHGTTPADLSTDFSADTLSGTVTFAEGESSKTIDIKVRGDLTVEKDETFQFILSNPSGITLTDASIVSTIVNDDTVQNSMSIAATSALKYEGNTGTTPFSFTVSRTGDITQSASVEWTASSDASNNKLLATNSDYASATVQSGKVSFNPGQSTATITVQVNGDLSFESDETFTVALSNAVGADIKVASATGKILNDDAIAPTISIANTSIVQYEGNSGTTPFNFTLTRIGDLQLESSVTWTISSSGGTSISPDDLAGSGTSALPTGTVKFIAGQSSANISINVSADAIKEQSEQFTLSLSSPTNALLGNKFSSATIVNDDYSGSLNVTGKAEVGSQLKIDSTLDYGSNIAFAGFQWQANGKDIIGSMGDSYTLTAADLGKSIGAVANYKSTLGNLSVKSNSTLPVTKFNHVPTGSVTIEGKLFEGKILKAASTLQDLDGLGYMSYTWEADGVVIPNARQVNFEVTKSLLGKSISVTVSYVDGIGNLESITSPATSKILGLIEGDDRDNILIGSHFDDQIIGEKGNDFLSGNEGKDALDGGEGNDTLYGGRGDDLIDGGAGFDKISYNGNLADYAIDLRNGSISDNRGIDGLDHIKNIELLQFADRSINLSVLSEFNSLAPATATSLIELYIAFFQRIPDANGLAYWISEAKNGKSLEQIASSFYAVGVQFSDLTGYKANMSNADFINTIYKNVLGRSEGADAGGLNYWENELSSGNTSRGNLVLSILAGAHTFKGDATYGHVADLLDNRYTVAKKISVDWGISYNSDQLNVSKSMETLALVTATDMSHALDLVGVPAMGIVFV